MAPEEIAKHFSIRTTTKRSLTTLRTFLTTFNPTKDNVEQLIVRRSQLDSIFQKYEQSQSFLELADDEEYGRDRDTFEPKFFDTKAQLETLINQMTEPVIANRNNDHVPLVLRTPTPTAEASASVKLPQINLPTFSGKYEDWHSFINIFDSIVHENTNLPEVQKFHYLKSSLKGDAALLVQSLKPCSEHYERARTILKDNFDRKQYIIDAHLTLLINNPINTKQDLKHLVSHCTQHINALKALDLNYTVLWEQTIIFLIKQKFDTRLAQDWELENKNKNVLPQLEQLLKFMDNRCFDFYQLQSTRTTRDNVKQPQRSHSHTASISNNNNNNVSNNTNKSKCNICNEISHPIYHCKDFLAKPKNERLTIIKSLNLCLNCLRSGHKVNDCKSQGCKTCNKKHNTLLHFNQEPRTMEQMTSSNTSQNNHIENQVLTLNSQTVGQLNTTSQILLGTAVILARDVKGDWISCRTLLDSGSQSNFISQHLAQLLKCSVEPANVSVVGISQSETLAKYKTQVTFKSRIENILHSVEFIILPKITTQLPTSPIRSGQWNLPKVQLADPKYFEPQDIDMLLGAELYFDLLRLDQIRLGEGLPNLQNTEFGWILSGKIKSSHVNQSIVSHCLTSSTSTNLDTQLLKFWTIEESMDKPVLTIEDKLVERHFQSTHSRDSNGKFIVTLPKRLEPTVLGKSKEIAVQRLIHLEKRFARDSQLKQRYTEFLDEYLLLGHMEEVSQHDIEMQPHYFLPHHPVLKESRVTTKIRVVFDASSKSTSGYSLNDVLLVGPTIQSNIFELLIRFRQHKYVLMADIVKMYRQVKVHESDTYLQLIVWRDSPQDKLKIYKLTTVTYGTSAAPFLAIRCLHELGKQSTNPAVSEIICQDFYVDDLITGSDNLQELIQNRNQIIDLLHQGGFDLNKWASNHSAVLEDIPDNKQTSSNILFSKEEIVKPLGLLWNAHQDSFYFQTPQIEIEPSSKRHILSTITKIFGPLGFLSPIIIKAKIILQRLWELKLPWDVPVTEELSRMWQSFCKQLADISEVNIPRFLFPHENGLITIHGFSDASEKAYGACLYMRSVDSREMVRVFLITSKSRVAPLRKTTLPRLELCAAQLLAKLYRKVISSFRNLTLNHAVMWSDSTIVLCWLKRPSRSLKTFVGNRVAEIQEFTADCSWRHVSSKDNPADIVSRGVEVDLATCSLWWTGPPWLKQNEKFWPEQPDILTNNEQIDFEIKPNISFPVTKKESFSVLHKYSSFVKLQRVVAYVRRFCHNKFKKQKLTGNLSSSELDSAIKTIIYMVQREVFQKEIKELQSRQTVSKDSQLIKLNPYLDSSKLLRVGGRLKHSDVSEEQKHPLVLPYDHHVSRLIVSYEHRHYLHCGTEQLLSILRRRFWILSARRLIKKISHNCINCFKTNPRPLNPLMGDLPSCRVKATFRPFLTVGVDYAGPVQLKESNRRGRVHTTKAYIALFVCFTTKAVHLDLVTDLTTECFLACFNRFFGRRGMCSEIYSDNGTTFVGANNQLKDLFEFIKNHENEITTQLNTQRIKWHFSPARSPNFGGQWESLVKCVKRHLNRVLQTSILTYEEYSTLLVGIEACINSRPLTRCSSDPTDPNVLTPSHFLIGDLLLEPVDIDRQITSKSLRSRWTQLKQMRKQFWSRWKFEYLQELQLRNKWYIEERSVVPGTLVILMDDNTLPLHWPMGLVQEIHPGSDGVVRVVTVKTNKGLYKRSVRKICVLPVNDKMKTEH